MLKESIYQTFPTRWVGYMKQIMPYCPIVNPVSMESNKPPLNQCFCCSFSQLVSPLVARLLSIWSTPFTKASECLLYTIPNPNVRSNYFLYNMFHTNFLSNDFTPNCILFDASSICFQGPLALVKVSVYYVTHPQQYSHLINEAYSHNEKREINNFIT